MRHRPLGQSGISASVVGLGTWAIGGWLWGGSEETESIDAIHAAIDEGMNLIDTAPAYGLGFAEELVGKAIAGRRHKVVIATKCGLVWHVNKGTYYFDEKGKAVYRYLGPESIEYEVNQSLKRLKTDYIDLLQTHWQDPTTSIEDTMSALLDLKAKGKIRAIGISNATVGDLQQYVKVGPIDTDQEQYNMLNRQIETEILPFCREHHIAELAYSPLCKGLLTGKIGPERIFRGDDLRNSDPQFSIENRKRIMEMLGRFRPVADYHHLTLSQLVIAWTIAQSGITHALVGGRNRLQVLENAKSGDIMLTDEDLKIINEAISEYTAVAQAR